MKILFRTAAFVTLSATALTHPALAALGQSAATIQHDQVVMRGQLRSGSANGHSIETITVAGLEIKEYVSPDGLVFAVVWKGTGMPDLPLLLGEYFERYREGLDKARTRKPRVREPFSMKSDGLVVEQAGNSRSLWGRAYLSTHLPPGVKPEDIQ
jgi:hypothetical protein